MVRRIGFPLWPILLIYSWENKRCGSIEVLSLVFGKEEKEKKSISAGSVPVDTIVVLPGANRRREIYDNLINC